MIVPALAGRRRNGEILTVSVDMPAGMDLDCRQLKWCCRGGAGPFGCCWLWENHCQGQYLRRPSLGMMRQTAERPTDFVPPEQQSWEWYLQPGHQPTSEDAASGGGGGGAPIPPAGGAAPAASVPELLKSKAEELIEGLLGGGSGGRPAADGGDGGGDDDWIPWAVLGGFGVLALLVAR